MMLHLFLCYSLIYVSLSPLCLRQLFLEGDFFYQMKYRVQLDNILNQKKEGRDIWRYPALPVRLVRLTKVGESHVLQYKDKVFLSNCKFFVSFFLN